MVSCSVTGCTNRSDRGKSKVTFHKFPSDENLKARWINAVCRKNWKPTKHSSVCGIHFEEKCFDRSSPFKILLLDNSVPTIFPSLSFYHQKKRKQKRAIQKHAKPECKVNPASEIMKLATADDKEDAMPVDKLHVKKEKNSTETEDMKSNKKDETEVSSSDHEKNSCNDVEASENCGNTKDESQSEAGTTNNNEQASEQCSENDSTSIMTSIKKEPEETETMEVDVLSNNDADSKAAMSSSGEKNADAESGSKALSSSVDDASTTKKDDEESNKTKAEPSSIKEATPGKSSMGKEEKEHSKKDGEPKKKKSKGCVECGARKGLKLQVLFQGKMRFLCSDTCFKSFKQKQKHGKPSTETSSSSAAAASAPAATDSEEKAIDKCGHCTNELDANQGYFPSVGELKPLCSMDCLIKYNDTHKNLNKCAQCKKQFEFESNSLSWETMVFCNEDCLGKYQSFLGSHCTCCQSPVQQASLGKYCVCFGADIRQFCSGSCLEEFKKNLKVCSFCQKDLSSGVDSFLAPVGDKGQFKDFCTQQCMERYETMNAVVPPKKQECSYCKKQGTFKIQVEHNGATEFLCSETCVAGFRYTNKIGRNMCESCYKFFEAKKDDQFYLVLDGSPRHFCTKECMTLFVLSQRKIVPCVWCKVKKYNFDMIEKTESNGTPQIYCSLNCLSLFRVNQNATSSKVVRCDHCSKNLPAQYHLTMSDGSIRNFCNYQCVIYFQNQFTNVPTLTTNTTSRQTITTVQGVKVTSSGSGAPVISNVMSLAPARATTPSSVVGKLVPQKLVATRQPVPSIAMITSKPQVTSSTLTMSTPTSTSTVPGGSQVMREVVVRPPVPKSVKNKTVSCKPIMQTKGISCKPHPCHKAVQTDENPRTVIVPIPVPVYTPVPLHMFSQPVPCPVAFPVPVPAPFLVPVSKESSASQMMKQLKDMQAKSPNPFESELLSLADMVENGSKGQAGSSSMEGTKGKENCVFSEKSKSEMKSLAEQDFMWNLQDDYNFKDGSSNKRSVNSGGTFKLSKKSKTDEMFSHDADVYSSLAQNADSLSDSNSRLKVP